MGKRNPVRLVSAVVKRKSAVVTGKLFEANIPPTTISPLPIATRVIMTCKIVKAPTDIPRIMESPVVDVLARRGSISKGGRHGDTLLSLCAWQHDDNCSSALTQQVVSNPRRPVPNERRRRRPPHGRRTGTTGEWPPAAR